MISVHEQGTDSGYYIGWLTLNLPQTLNALTLDMVRVVRMQLQQWATRDNIACVVLRGEGRGFCAGGDVRRMRTGILAGDDYCARFFEHEYRLDHMIHHYPKPLLCWGHGVVMGGGLGLLVGASHRVVTQSARLAMPEVSIGLYPDVGASVFLNRLPEGLGLFLGITGCEWNAADAVAMGIADFALSDGAKHDLADVLIAQSWMADVATNRQILSAALSRLPAAEQPLQLWRHHERIAAACAGGLPDALENLPALQQGDDAIHDAWFAQALDNLRRGCPVTVALVPEQLRRARNLSLADALRMEWCLSMQCCARPDFPEGVRAQLVDKDKAPRWSFASAREVPADVIAAHFQPLAGSAAEHPLQDLR